MIEKYPAKTNMELDAALKPGGSGSFRVYGWEKVAVSLGFSQRAESVVRPGMEHRVDLVHRPTGGRAVLHGHDVTVGCCVGFDRLGLPRGSRSLRLAYRQVIAPIISALNHVGVPAALGESSRFAEHPAMGSVDCFAHVAGNDVVSLDTGQKVCGCALRMGETSILLQASIPVARPELDPRDVLIDGVAPVWIDVDVDALSEALSREIAGFVSGAVAV